MNLLIRMALLVLVLVGLTSFAVFLSGDGDSDGAPREEAGVRARFTSSAQCAQCHADAWQEWRGSHHQIAYLNPEVRQLSDGFRNKSCQACHLPRPVAQTGYEKRTLHRTTRPDEGVSCLTCHLGADGEILGRNSAPGAPCQPQASAAMTSVAMCASCHNQHGTTDQWRATPFAKNGTGCSACHMPSVPRADGRPGRGHVFAGSHDVAMLRRALRFEARVEAGEIVVEVENVGAGHNFPTEERSRAGDVEVAFDDATEWQRLHRFRLPYRDEPLPDTTLPYGATETLWLAFPEDAVQARVRMWYRLTPFVGDDDPRSALLFEQEIVRGGEGFIVADVVRPPLPESSAFRRPPPSPLPDAVASAAPVSDGSEAQDVIAGLPALQLEPQLASLQAIVAAGPAPPDADRLRRLAEMVELAFVPGLADARAAGRMRRSLLEQDDAFYALEAALEHDEPQVRRSVAYELGQLAQQASVVPLALRLKYEIDDLVTRIWVVDALAQLGNYSGLFELLPLLDRPDTAELAGQRAVSICRAAGEELTAAPTWDELRAGLRRLDAEWRAVGAAPEPDALTRARMARHLVELEAFQLRGVDEARFTLARLGAAPVPLLRAALHASEPYLRTHALEVLRDLGPAGRSAGPDVLPLLGDPLTGADAARALASIDAREAAPALIRCLASADAELRTAAAAALGPLGATDAVPALTMIVDDEAASLDLRVHSAFSLALLQPDGSARAWLERCRERGDYHASTLAELIGRLDRGR